MLVRVADATLSVTFESKRTTPESGADHQVVWSWTHVGLAEHAGNLTHALAAALAAPPADWLQLLTARRPELVWRRQVFTALVDRLAEELQAAVDEQAEAILAGTADVSELLE